MLWPVSLLLVTKRTEGLQVVECIGSPERFRTYMIHRQEDPSPTEDTAEPVTGQYGEAFLGCNRHPFLACFFQEMQSSRSTLVRSLQRPAIALGLITGATERLQIAVVVIPPLAAGLNVVNGQTFFGPTIDAAAAITHEDFLAFLLGYH